MQKSDFGGKTSRQNSNSLIRTLSKTPADSGLKISCDTIGVQQDQENEARIKNASHTDSNVEFKKHNVTEQQKNIKYLKKCVRKGNKVCYTDLETVVVRNNIIQEKTEDPATSEDLEKTDSVHSGESMFKNFHFERCQNDAETQKCVEFWKKVMRKNLEPIKYTLTKLVPVSCGENDKVVESKEIQGRDAKMETKVKEEFPDKQPSFDKLISKIYEELKQKNLHKMVQRINQNCRTCELIKSLNKDDYSSDNQEEDTIKEIDGWKPRSTGKDLSRLVQSNYKKFQKGGERPLKSPVGSRKIKTLKSSDTIGTKSSTKTLEQQSPKTNFESEAVNEVKKTDLEERKPCSCQSNICTCKVDLLSILKEAGKKPCCCGFKNCTCRAGNYISQQFPTEECTPVSVYEENTKSADHVLKADNPIDANISMKATVSSKTSDSTKTGVTASTSDSTRPGNSRKTGYKMKTGKSTITDNSIRTGNSTRTDKSIKTDSSTKTDYTIKTSNSTKADSSVNSGPLAKTDYSTKTASSAKTESSTKTEYSAKTDTSNKPEGIQKQRSLSQQLVSPAKESSRKTCKICIGKTQNLTNNQEFMGTDPKLTNETKVAAQAASVTYIMPTESKTGTTKPTVTYSNSKVYEASAREHITTDMKIDISKKQRISKEVNRLEESTQAVNEKNTTQSQSDNSNISCKPHYDRTRDTKSSMSSEDQHQKTGGKCRCGFPDCDCTYTPEPLYMTPSGRCLCTCGYPNCQCDYSKKIAFKILELEEKYPIYKHIIDDKHLMSSDHSCSCDNTQCTCSSSPIPQGSMKKDHREEVTYCECGFPDCDCDAGKPPRKIKPNRSQASLLIPLQKKFQAAEQDYKDNIMEERTTSVSVQCDNIDTKKVRERKYCYICGHFDCPCEVKRYIA